MRYKKMMVCAASAALCIVNAVPAMAAYDKINSVKIHFDVEDYDETGVPEPSAEVSERASYHVSDITSYADYDTDTSPMTAAQNMDNVYVVTLSSDDTHRFYVSRAKDIKVTGLDAVYLRAARKDNGQTLEVMARLEKLKSLTGAVQEATWNNDGTASWTSADNALEYQLYITGPKLKKYLQTGSPSYDFRPLLLHEGSYEYTVKPLAQDGQKGTGTSSGSLYVSEEQAEQNREAFGVQVEKTFTDEEKMEPSTQSVTYLNIGWQESEDGRYWYRNQDGTYPQAQWMNLDGAWYFFDKDGYMATDTFLLWGENEYYIQESGQMLTNSAAPDKRAAGEDGVLAGKRSRNYEYEFLNETLQEDETMFGPGMVKKDTEDTTTAQAAKKRGERVVTAGGQ